MRVEHDASYIPSPRPSTPALKTTSVWHLPKPMASQFEPRTHYREVFEEECEPYDRLTSVPEMCQTLYDCTKGCHHFTFSDVPHIVSLALQLLWKYDFVHRDVSTGNALWDPKLRGGRGDLEFVTNVRDKSSDDAKMVRLTYPTMKCRL